jgi:acetyl-CoA carboxylase biotin carboxyl carrier protein
VTETVQSTDEAEAPLDAICRNALRLLGTAAEQPTRLRIEANGTCVEMEWPARAPVPATAEPAVPATIAAVAESARAQDSQNGLGAGFSILAPTVGTFYHAPEPGAAPFVWAGEDVETGQQVGIIEVMKLLTPVMAERPCRVLEFLVGNGMPVEYGQPLISCAPPLRP